MTSCGKPPVWVIFLLEIAALIFVSNILDIDAGKMSVHLDLMQKLFGFFCDFFIVRMNLLQSWVEMRN